MEGGYGTLRRPEPESVPELVPSRTVFCGWRRDHQLPPLRVLLQVPWEHLAFFDYLFKLVKC